MLNGTEQEEREATEVFGSCRLRYLRFLLFGCLSELDDAMIREEAQAGMKRR
jgi:hypothetical protein